MNIIAAADGNMGIGNKGELLFSIPDDMKFFKKMTTGKTVIMGRKTYESLPVRPLPGRRNIILTKNKTAAYPGAEICCSTDELKSLTENTDGSDLFVIGGEEIYRLLLPLCDTAFLTLAENVYEADRHFPDIRKDSDWYCEYSSQKHEYNGIFYRFTTYKKKRPFSDMSENKI